MKKKLGISGILTNEYAWRCLADDTSGNRGVQIDLLIDRSDSVIDVWEMKYSKGQFAISAEYSNELVRKRNVLQVKTGTKKAIHTIIVTTEGVAHNEEWNEIQGEVTLNDLFEN